MGNTGFLKKSSRILSLKCRQAYAFSFKNSWAKEKPKTLLFLDNIQNTDQVGSGPTRPPGPWVLGQTWTPLRASTSPSSIITLSQTLRAQRNQTELLGTRLMWPYKRAGLIKSLGFQMEPTPCEKLSLSDCKRNFYHAKKK